MTNEHNNDNKREPGQQSDREKSDTKHQAGQQAQQDKSSKGFGAKSDNERQKESDKGKIATSSPGGSKPGNQRV